MRRTRATKSSGDGTTPFLRRAPPSPSNHEEKMLVHFNQHDKATVGFSGRPKRWDLLNDRFSYYDLMDRARQSKFKHFFSGNNFQFFGQLIHALLLRKVECRQEDEIKILLGKRVLRFGKHEFGLITGLSFVTTEGWIEFTGSRTLRDTYFSHVDVDKVTFSELEACFSKCKDKEDVWKLGLLYFVEGILFGMEDRNFVESDLISLVDVPDNFFSYSWGERVFLRTLESFQKDMKNYSSTYKLYGWIPVLQHWALETLPQLAKKYATDKGKKVPRMTSWTINLKKAPHANELIELLMDDQLEVTPLSPTRPKELEYLLKNRLRLRLEEVVDPDADPDTAAPNVPNADDSAMDELRRCYDELRRSYDELAADIDEMRRSHLREIDDLRTSYLQLERSRSELMDTLQSRDESLQLLQQKLDTYATASGSGLQHTTSRRSS